MIAGVDVAGRLMSFAAVKPHAPSCSTDRHLSFGVQELNFYIYNVILRLCA
jgi:hypothetical protein